GRGTRASENKCIMFLKNLSMQASMRPRHACLGKHILPSHYVYYLCPASMRPRHACLGKPDAPRRRISSKAASMRPRHACLGKPAGSAALIGRLTAASMRPRHACLGKLLNFYMQNGVEWELQ